MMDDDAIELRLDESSELVFTVKVEAPEKVKPSFRFVCEGRGVDYSFACAPGDDGTVNVTVPPMKDRLTEGLHPVRLEAIIDDRFFVPIEMKANFVRPTNVQVESVQKKGPAKKRSEPVQVSAGSDAVRVINENRRNKKPAAAVKKKRSSLREEVSRERLGSDIEQVREMIRKELKGSR